MSLRYMIRKGVSSKKYRTDKPFVSFIVTSDDRELYVKSVDQTTKDDVILRYAL